MYKTILTLLLTIISWISFSQRNCGTDTYNKDIIRNYPELSARYGRTNEDNLLADKLSRLTGIINIPVVVHIVYNTTTENLSDEIINSQIQQLNLDYSGKNSDVNNVPNEFKDRVADCQIQFELKAITRTKTNKNRFLIQLRENARGEKVYDPSYEPIKFSGQGGNDGYPCTQYLNMWVGNITDGSSSQLLGYAAFPGGLCEYDGVVIYYKCFGITNLYPHFDKGRTVTHEVGHWLNLRHIGGDKYGGCGDDFVSDTPPQKGGTKSNGTGNNYGQNFGCPPHPLSYSAECPGTSAEMFMNYMDYVDDPCMFMFTKNQKDRMRSLFVEGGDRAYFLYSASANRQLLVDDNKRNDIFTPIITDFKKYFHCRPVHDTCRYAFIFWTQSDNAKEYKVLAKKVSSSTWQVITTPNNYIKIGGLNSHVLYEVKVQAILNNDTFSAESTPYVFKLKGSNPFKLKQLKLIR